MPRSGSCLMEDVEDQASMSADLHLPGSPPSCCADDVAEHLLAMHVTESGNGGVRYGTAVPQQKGQGPGNPVQLGIDVWRIIWDKLSVIELAKLATVAKAWRDAGVERAAKRRAAAVARVTAPDHIPDSELTVPQQVLRAVRRHLLGQDPFTGEPSTESATDDYRTLKRREGDVFLDELWDLRDAPNVWGLRLEGHFGGPRFCSSLRWGPPPSPEDPYGPSTPLVASLFLAPRFPEECEWMQGLLLALSEGSIGEPCSSGDHGAGFPVLRGLLARCTILQVVWRGQLHDLKGLVLLPLFHKVEWEGLDYNGNVRARMRWNRGVPHPF